MENGLKYQKKKKKSSRCNQFLRLAVSKEMVSHLYSYILPAEAVDVNFTHLNKKT